ncbi:tripartite tricarboxylate transporter substrate binding protein [Pigmentiphaga sp. H8]|uniref:Bug family tripartite tricarboxylate transporter substrate binding protein n=1 Tax=Pigmentiphaga sp. H8 TaxID=2488560 RepID=UPI0013755D1C|nr:tripartite tricarboxylate transporter substrate binding protein [Pigmentiphaga sp. H8]
MEEMVRILLHRINFYFLLTRLLREFIIVSPRHPEAAMKILKISAHALSAFLFCTGAHAQGEAYPNHPIRFIVPYAPGAGSDTFARLIADKLGKRLGQTVFVDNRPGSSGNIGADAVFRAAPDGYTLLFTAPGPLVTSQALYSKLTFVPDEFVPISVIATSPSTLVANPKSGLKNLQDLLTAARARPDKLNYSSGGTGSTPHLAAEMFKQLAKVKIFQIPYSGSGPALAAVVSGETDIAFVDLGSVLPFVRKGQLIALGVGSESRKAGLPDVPAIGEVIPGFVSMTWFGMAAPPKTPEHIVNKLSAVVNEILKEPDTMTRLSQMNADPIGGTPADMAKFIKQERERWSTVIRNTGTKLD